jgi:hypothetical protein
MKKRVQPLAGKRRRITDDQIRILQSWVPFKTLARALGISEKYATKLRKGKVHYKNKSP